MISFTAHRVCGQGGNGGNGLHMHAQQPQDDPPAAAFRSNKAGDGSGEVRLRRISQYLSLPILEHALRPYAKGANPQLGMLSTLIPPHAAQFRSGQDVMTASVGSDDARSQAGASSTMSSSSV